MVSIEQAKKLVKVARKSIEYALENHKTLEEKAPGKEFLQKQGVFVTLNHWPSRELRGCIGFPEPILPLWEATINAAASAAFQDLRFPPVSQKELSEIVIEVTVLSVPEEIKFSSPKELLEKIKIGMHGLIIKKGFASGLLLPQVATEWGFSKEQFLDALCEKAGLQKGEWKHGAEIFVFEGKVFKELFPNGKIAEDNNVKS
jgi:uncharacterized protein